MSDTDLSTCLTPLTADCYNSKVLSVRGGAGIRVGYTKIGLRASPNTESPRITCLAPVCACCGTCGLGA